MSPETRTELWLALRPLVQLFAAPVLLCAVLLLNVVTNHDDYRAEPAPIYLAPSTSVPHLTPAPATTTAAPLATSTTSTTVMGERWVTSSTNYCERGTTAGGTAARDGVVAVAMPRFAGLHGTRWRVLTGPLAGKVVTVEDKGPKARFDVWVPSCADAIRYGVRTITVERIR